ATSIQAVRSTVSRSCPANTRSRSVFATPVAASIQASRWLNFPGAKRSTFRASSERRWKAFVAQIPGSYFACTLEETEIIADTRRNQLLTDSLRLAPWIQNSTTQRA